MKSLTEEQMRHHPHAHRWPSSPAPYVVPALLGKERLKTPVLSEGPPTSKGPEAAPKAHLALRASWLSLTAKASSSLGLTNTGLSKRLKVRASAV